MLLLRVATRTPPSVLVPLACAPWRSFLHRSCFVLDQQSQRRAVSGSVAAAVPVPCVHAAPSKCVHACVAVGGVSVRRLLCGVQQLQSLSPHIVGPVRVRWCVTCAPSLALSGALP